MSSKTNCVAALFIILFTGSLLPLQAQSLNLQLRYQQPTQPGSTRFHRLTTAQQWPADEVAVIVCDMWDSHHCVNAVRRVQELAPKIDQFISQLRSQGAIVIHAPSDCMAAYKEHPSKLRAEQAPPASEYPEKIESWCDQIIAEQPVDYPLDQAEGGEDDDLDEHQRWAEQLASQGRNPRAPWKSQIATIRIDDRLDYISDSGKQIWNILQSRGISRVMLVGVHTNMCVLGRPFGLRRMSAAGKDVVLVRDLTDTMYDHRAWPYANHFTGTDLIVSHIERHVCSTISSNQVVGGEEFRFSKDHRPQLTMIIAEDEYSTEVSLPAFAANHLSQNFRVTYAFGSDSGSDSDRNRILSLQDLTDADAVLISVRRRPLPEAEIRLIQQFVRTGKPMIGIRTASHPFSIRTGKLDEGLVQWPEFDREVWGGNYTNHYGNDLKANSNRESTASNHSILQALGKSFELKPGGSLYKTSPLAAGTTLLLTGSVAGKAPEPLAWTYVRADGGRSFYTSLGHVDDFSQPQFETLLSAGIHWACELPLPNIETVEAQNTRFAAGKGRQRK